MATPFFASFDANNLAQARLFTLIILFNVNGIIWVAAIIAFLIDKCWVLSCFQIKTMHCTINKTMHCIYLPYHGSKTLVVFMHIVIKFVRNFKIAIKSPRHISALKILQTANHLVNYNVYTVYGLWTLRDSTTSWLDTSRLLPIFGFGCFEPHVWTPRDYWFWILRGCFSLEVTKMKILRYSNILLLFNLIEIYLDKHFIIIVTYCVFHGIILFYPKHFKLTLIFFCNHSVHNSHSRLLYLGACLNFYYHLFQMRSVTPSFIWVCKTILCFLQHNFLTQLCLPMVRVL